LYLGLRCNLLRNANERGSVADPHRADADPDPACHFDADPDPACHIYAHPDPDLLVTLMRIRIRILPFTFMRMIRIRILASK
jgi:hypothetical protein